MKGYCSLRRIALVLVFALLGLVQPVPARQSEDGDIRLRGTFLILSERGTHSEVAVSGHSKPGGSFTGLFTGKQFQNGDVVGEVTLDFGGGDTLTYFQELEFDEQTGLIVGTYEITGGTGRFEGATGSGSTVIDPAGDGTGTFELEGSLSN